MRWCCPPPCMQVRPIAEDEMFKVLKSGKRMKKSWKRMVTKVREEGLLRGWWVVVCAGCFWWGGGEAGALDPGTNVAAA